MVSSYGLAPAQQLKKSPFFSLYNESKKHLEIVNRAYVGFLYGSHFYAARNINMQKAHFFEFHILAELSRAMRRIIHVYSSSNVFFNAQSQLNASFSYGQVRFNFWIGSQEILRRILMIYRGSSICKTLMRRKLNAKVDKTFFWKCTGVYLFSMRVVCKLVYHQV